MYVFFYALELWHLMVALSTVIITQSNCVNVYYSNNNVHTGALLYNDGFLRRHDTLPSVGFIANGRTANSFAPDHHHGIDVETYINPGGYQDHYKQSSGKRGFRVLLSIRKLRKIKRRKINRMNKDIELYRRVKERRLKNPNRLIDIRKVNFINDKCNPQLMRLPVSPLVDLNGIVPYKTVPEMTSQVPFNPAPVLLSLGYKFKPRGKSKYERFCEPYPMDEVLQVMDARSLGAISRMSGKYKITGDGTRMPTPMDSQPVPPGASVGKGYGFGLAKKPEPKRKPMPLSIFDPYKPEESHLVDTLDEVNQLRREALDYVERLVKPLMPKSKNASKGKMGSDNKSGTPKHDEIPTDGIKVPYLDDACNEGDIMRNPRYLGEYRNKYWIHPFYGNATMPGEERRLVEEHNRAHPDKPLVYEEYKVDIIYCHSNGTIVYLGENQEPYTNEADDFVLEGEDPREPRFVIQASAGFIKEEGLQIGQILPLVDSDMRRRYYDNIFFMPKSLRKLYPVHLPDGRPIE